MSVRLPFFRLQGSQAETILSPDVTPPFERGTTCSNVSCDDGNFSPQYWQRKRSRRNTLKRVNATRLGRGTYARIATTEGRRNSIEGLRTTLSYSATTA